MAGDLEIYASYIIHQRQLMADMESTADIPVRLFRANKGYRFWGCVHEQIGSTIDANAYPDPRMIIPGVEFLHYGYVTEAMRKHKVLNRNMRLMEKEHQMNPHRDIGVILYTRDLLQIVTWQMTEGEPLDVKLVGHCNQVLRMLEIYIAQPSHICHPLAMIFYQQALGLLGTSNTASYAGCVPMQVQIGLVGQHGVLQGEYRMRTRWFLSTEELQRFLSWQSSELVKHLSQIPRQHGWE